MNSLRRFLESEVGLRPGVRCLDAGCGMGVALAEMADLVKPDGFVVGVDLEREPLAVADARTWAISRIALCNADVAHLPFLPRVFDTVYANLLLLWVASPASAIDEFVRVTRSGGRVALVDLDLSTMRFEPAVPSWERYMTALRRFQERRGFDGEIGRKLYHLCHRAGLTDIRVQANVSIATPETSTWDAATGLVTSTLAAALVEDSLLELEALARLEAEIAAISAGSLFIGGVTYGVSGRTP